MKNLNAEALRTKLMSVALHRQIQQANAAEAAAAEKAQKAQQIAAQPKRVQQVPG